MARLAIALLAALCLSAAAADIKHMTVDNLVSSKSVKAKTASSYYDNTEMACMNQMNFKNCRYTGCPVENYFSVSDGEGGTCPGVDADPTDGPCMFCTPDSIYFQTDFSCCPKDHEYYGGQHHDIGLVGLNDKIGTCDWEISMYRTPWDTLSGDDESDAWMPHYTDDGTALKWGTAWGTCYLNAEAEHCDSPLCERMAINIQGGLYATCAYSLDEGHDFPPLLEFCNGDSPAPLDAVGGTEPRKGNSTSAKRGAGDRDIVDSPLEMFMHDIGFYSLDYLADACGWDGLRKSLPATGRREYRREFMKNLRNKKNKAGKAKIMNDYQEEKYYPGLALVISGPMSVASKKNHKLEETGMYEFTIAYVSMNDAVAPNNRWPIVRERGAKVRFTHEEEYYQGGSSK